MDRKYWEKIAGDYDEEIFDVLANDSSGRIVSAIRQSSSPRKTVMDVGCAVGKWLPLLSNLFQKVYATDISAKNLDIAASRNNKLTNIDYRRIDMSSSGTRLPRVDVAICINAILTSSITKRNAFFRNLGKLVAKGGSLILVVPSFESSMFVSVINEQLKIERRRPVGDKVAVRRFKNILQGNLEIDGVDTKHYLEPELRMLLGMEGFEVKSIERIEYEWTTEFLRPPKWLKDPRPWDWLVTAKRL